jgi:hypothetical protein
MTIYTTYPFRFAGRSRRETQIIADLTVALPGPGFKRRCELVDAVTVDQISNSCPIPQHPATVTEQGREE